MLKLKSCPRCKKGDVALDRDQYGWYEYCIQCGYIDDSTSIVEIRKQRPQGAKEKQKLAGIPSGVK